MISLDYLKLLTCEPSIIHPPSHQSISSIHPYSPIHPPIHPSIHLVIISTSFKRLLYNHVSSICKLDTLTPAPHAYLEHICSGQAGGMPESPCFGVLSSLLPPVSSGGVLLTEVCFSNTKQPSQSLHPQPPILLDPHTWATIHQPYYPNQMPGN